MAVFRLPDLGEGLTEAEVLRWLVAPGDVVTLNQPIVEVETAKAAVEVPSPFAGTVAELHGEEGVALEVGAPLITISTGEAEPEREPVLVGYGPRAHSGARRARRPVAGTPAAPVEPPVEPPVEVAAEVGLPEIGMPEVGLPEIELPELDEPAAARTAREPAALAKPPVRKLARELGVDLAALTPTGPHGTVSREDVQAAAARAVPVQGHGQGHGQGQGQGQNGAAPALPQVPGHAPDARRVPLSAVQRAMADAMVRSVTEAPHVTVFLTVDVTRSTELLTRLKAVPELEGIRLTPLLLAARALLLAVRRHPRINSSWDGDAVVEHGRVNLGIAAATPRGLIVPNLKDAGSLSLADLGRALGALTATAREGRTPVADMQRGTITITNIGVFGVDTGTPILNPGEAAILAVGAIRPTPWAVDGQVVVRDVCQLALSFDHRVVDGELGARVLAEVGRVLSDPEVALALG